MSQPDFQRFFSDPEFKRLWDERNAAISALGPAGQSFMNPGRQKIGEGIGKQLAARFKALGGNSDEWYFSIGRNGEPVVTRPTSTAGAIGKALMYTGLAAGAAFGAPAIAGALGAGGGGAAGAATAANVAGATGAAGAAGAAGAGAGVAGAAGAAGATGAAAAGGSMLPILSAAAGGASAVGDVFARRGATKAQNEADIRRVQLEESMANPFRHQLDQAKTIGRLDMMENARVTPTTVTPPARYADKVPTIGGGFSFAPSADVATSAGALKRNVMAGQVAPSVTDPNTAGRTGVLDLVRLAAGGDPTAPGARPLPYARASRRR